MKMGKCNTKNDDIQVEADAIDNNNEWKVSYSNILINNKCKFSLLLLTYFRRLMVNIKW